MALKTKDICLILKECAVLGVRRIKISSAEVEIEFSGPKDPEDINKINLAIQSEPQATPDAPSGEEKPLIQTPQDPKKLDEDDELAELRITNPLEFEERIARGELVDAETQDD